MDSGPQFHSSIPGHGDNDFVEPGTAPIPPGTMRFWHRTPDQNIDSIAQTGFQRSRHHSNITDGADAVFGTAGAPDHRDMRSLGEGRGRQFVEAWAKPDQIDVNHPESDDHISHLESASSTVTFHGDIPPHQIVAIHQPWHQAHRELLRNLKGPDDHSQDYLHDDPDFKHSYGRALKRIQGNNQPQ